MKIAHTKITGAIVVNDNNPFDFAELLWQRARYDIAILLQNKMYTGGENLTRIMSQRGVSVEAIHSLIRDKVEAHGLSTETEHLILEPLADLLGDKGIAEEALRHFEVGNYAHLLCDFVAENPEAKIEDMPEDVMTSLHESLVDWDGVSETQATEFIGRFIGLCREAIPFVKEQAAKNIRQGQHR